ncbi:MAG TPA: DUF2203 family protein [Thermoanaerobaculia bacterium]|nr:DUF2203 family protein [Thermoanaerobaculia bacterium]
MARRKRIFSYERALALLPEARRITGEAVDELEQLLSAETVSEEQLEVPAELVPEYQRIVSAWAEAILDMGIEVKGLWLIDFDSGAGYYCWRYPEETLEWFHGYEEGFPGRIKLN